MDQSEFSSLNETSCQQTPLEQQVTEVDPVAATKSSCTDCDSAISNNQISPLFVPASSALEFSSSAKASFASLVERTRFLW
ncbi:MAG: hypothetical protein QG574_5355 [Cyanobacteriota bacterium erpe_2018_sw_21hr_WHONDRS-SW48-000092_B_bin.40]|jgi:hypothetical protein|nr:hypothetical protein [Cyanobacteriota bacterium erpe_2018_sw_21hr_WHONDRS-SW48-000092_B_bin.40]